MKPVNSYIQILKLQKYERVLQDLTIKTKKTMTQDQVKLNIFPFLLGQSDPSGY